MLEAIFEIIFQLAGELILQLFAELLVELGWRGVGAVFERRPHPLLALLGYSIIGASLGGLSLLVLPESLVSGDLRIVNLIATPIVAGGWMALVGALLRRRGKTTLRLESFGYGFAFAFVLNLVRFFFAV